MEEAAGDRYNRAEGPRLLMNFRGAIEICVSVGDVLGMAQVGAVEGREAGMMILKKVVIELIDVIKDGVSSGTVKATVGGGVGEVLEAFSNVDLAFEDAGPKIFVGREDNEVQVGA